MADETPVDNQQPKPEAKTPAIDESIAKSIAAGFSQAVEEIRNGQVRRAAPTNNVVSDPPIDEVREEDILEAVEQGDKAKAASLMRKQRLAQEAKLARELRRVTQAGGAALASTARLAADRLEHYNGKWKKLIDERIGEFQAQFPDQIVTFDHYKWAHDNIVGEHFKEIAAEEREAEIRRERAREEALIPGETGRSAGEPEHEPTSLRELLKSDDWSAFNKKQRAFGGRSEEEELKRAGFKGGLKEFAAVRKEMAVIQEQFDESFGLDKDWIDEKGMQGPQANKEKGEWV